MEEKEMKIRKNTGLKVTIVILSILVIALIGFICYDKGILFSSKETSSSDTTEKAKNNTENTTENGEDEGVTFSNNELEKYVDYISPVSIGPSDLIYNTSYVSAQNLSAADKMKYIGSHLYSKHTSTADYQYDIISENDVKSVIEKIYGPNSYEKATFNLGCGDYTLNERESNYYSKTGCGGTTTTFVSNVVIDYKATKSKLEITTAYAIFDGMQSTIYKDYNKSIPLDNYSGGATDEVNLYMKEYAKNNKDKLNHIVYTFESNDGKNYYFKEFTNNK